MALSRITEAEREKLRNKSAQSLPDVPSQHGWTPQQFRNAITRVLLDNNTSFYSHFNRLVDELVEEYLTKENEKVLKFDKAYSSCEEFAKDCLLNYNNGKIKIFYGLYNVAGEGTYDLLGVCRRNIGVTILSGNGELLYSDGLSIKPITINQINSLITISDTANINELIVSQKLNAINAFVQIAEPSASNNPTTKGYVDNITTILMDKIDGIEAAQNLLDIVSNKSNLDKYDKALVKINDKIKVLQDETKGNAGTYYKWNGSIWEYIGKDGAYYTQTEVDNIKNTLQAEIDSLRQLVNTLMSSTVSYKED